jgi:tetratricopeptide (TPR) repeat protein
MTYVDEQYRTVSYDILAGHSFGGTFAAYALLEKPELFNAYIAISPYLMWDDDHMVKEAAKKLKPEYAHPIFFYMTVGDEPDYYKALADFNKLVETRSPKDISLTYVLMPEENHRSIPHKSIYQGLEEIYSGWQLPTSTFIAGFEAIDKHYQALSEMYGYRIRTPEYTLNALGYNYLNNDEMEQALKVFAENIDRYPESANVYDSYGEALEKNEQLALAEANYAKAVEIAEKESHPYLKVYVKNLERVSKKLTP